MYRFLIIIALLSCLPSQALKNVSISKCCPHNQKISISKDDKITCEDGTEKKWLPKIYSPASRNFVNDTPKNWFIKPKFLECNGTIKALKQRAAIHSYIITTTGNLILANSIRQMFSADKYCIDVDYALICQESEKLREEKEPPKTPIRKCCGPNAVMSELKKSCVVMNGTDYKIELDDRKELVSGFPGCSSDYIFLGKLHEGVLKDDGSLALDGGKTAIPADGFCLEHVLENAGKSPTILSCHEHLPSSTVAPNNEVSVHLSDLRLKLYPAGLLLSAVFLAATLAAGTVLPASHHHQLHWKCQTNHVACLLVADVLLAITQLAGTSMAAWLCITIAILMHFLFLAAFFWLNTMCFNIWWTFRDLRPASMEKRQEQWRLRLYELYAWGGPLIIATVAIVLDSLPSSPEYNFLRPRFGETSCWFYGNMEILTYFYGPVGVLLVVNLILFAATARELTCGLWKRELVKSTTERAALGRVCMKLVVVMGVTWIADVVSWAVGGPKAVWYITDLINTLQGVFIFIVVACQPQVWSAIKRLWCRRQSLAGDITVNGNHHSSSSHAPPSYGDSVTSNVTNTTRSIPLETNC